MALTPTSRGTIKSTTTGKTYTTGSFTPSSQASTVVCIVTARASSANPQTPSVSGNGITYALLDSVSTTAGYTSLFAFYGRFTGAPTAGVVTVTFPSNVTNCQAEVFEEV